MTERALDTAGRIRLVSPPAPLIDVQTAFETSIEVDDTTSHLIAVATDRTPIYVHLLGTERLISVLRTLAAGNDVDEGEWIRDLTTEAPVQKPIFLTVDVLGERRSRVEAYAPDDDCEYCFQCGKGLQQGALSVKQRVTKREAVLDDTMDGGHLLTIGLHQECVAQFTAIVERAFAQTDLLLSEAL